MIKIKSEACQCNHYRKTIKKKKKAEKKVSQFLFKTFFFGIKQSIIHINIIKTIIYVTKINQMYGILNKINLKTKEIRRRQKKKTVNKTSMCIHLHLYYDQIKYYPDDTISTTILLLSFESLKWFLWAAFLIVTIIMFWH